jgi:transposase
VGLSLIATATFGLESVVARELAGLGYESRALRPGWLTFPGDELALARALAQALERARLLHPHPDKVLSPLFERIAFFDPRDKLQVKYEMLRSHEVEGLPINRAAQLFGYTRQGFYQLQQAFREEGMAGLLEKKRGRKGPVKCTPEIVAFLVREKQLDPELSGRELAERVLEEHGLQVHRRTVEKVVKNLGRPGPKKKRSVSA